MANKFQIVISAVDKSTATVRKINASIERLTRPISEIKRSTMALSKEVGFDRVGKSIGNVVKTAGSLAGRLTSIIAPLAAIVGGGSIAGTAALATEWGRLGSEVSRTAQNLGMATSELQALRGAAQAAGVSSEELTGGVKSLGDTMEDALFGRNQAALGMLNRLGIGIHKTADGSIDAARGLKDMASAVAGIKNAQAQGLVARTFGIEALLPLLRKGAKGIEEYQRKVDELGGVRSKSAIDAAEQFGLRMNYLSIAAQGVKSAIGERLLPILQPLIERFTNWVSVNRELIATKVGDFVEGLAHWIDNLDFNRIAADIEGFGKKIVDVVDFMGGWKNAALALVVILNAGLIASVINLGLALGGLAATTVPAVIRGFGLLAMVVDATLVPALLKGLLKTGLFVETLAAAASGIPVVGTALSALSSGILGVSAAITATPVGWLIAGAAAVAFSVYAIYKNWNNIVDFFREKWDGVKAAFDKSWSGGILKALWEFSPIKILGDTMNSLSKWLLGFDLYDAGKSIVAGLVRGIKAIASLLPKPVLKMLGLDEWATGSVAANGGAPSGAPQAPGGAGGASAGTGSAPIGIRQNNPGNLRSWSGAQSINGFAAFNTPEAGIGAMAKNLQAYQNKHGINTLSGIINRWAPPSENNTGAYIASMARQTGLNPNDKLDLNDPKVVAPLVSGIIKQENGHQPYSQEMINSAVAGHLGGSQPAAPVEITVHAPAGTKITARTKGGADAPIRVSYAMPTLVTP